MENAELLAKLTKEIMHEYFKSNLDTWIQYLDPHCVLIAADETIFSGVSMIRHALETHLKKGKGKVLSDEYFHIPLSKKVTIVIAYTITESKQNKSLQVINLISFVWQIKGTEPRIVYIHSSHHYFEHSSKEMISPFKKNHFHFQIARHLFEGISEKKKLCFMHGNKTIYLDTSMLLYIEGNRHTTLLHCIDNTYICTQTLQEIKKQLPDDFYQIHRSYIIHVDYLVSVCCYEAEMIDGTKIPIPASKYRQVKTDLEILSNKS